MSEILKKDSGTWGESVWILTADNYLVIGRGTVGDCPASDVPWHDYIEEIVGVFFQGEIKVPKGFSMKNFFAGYTNLEQIDMRDLDTEGVVSMQSMFSGCRKLQFVDMSGKNTKNVISMSRMFQDCKSLKYVDMSNIDTSNVTGMSQMFTSCSSLEEANLSGINTSNVANMLGMFMNCGSLKKIDLRDFDTSSVVDMSIMFSNCAALEEIDLTNFNTENVQDMSSMFLFCRNLKHLYIDGFDTRNVKNMTNMFAHCKKLNSLNLSSFDTRNTENMTGMFSGCNSLKHGKLGKDCILEGKETEWPLEIGSGETYCCEGAEFDLHFDPNGGAATKEYIKYSCISGDTFVTIDNCFKEPEGKVFKEWNTKRDGSGKRYKVGETTDPIYGDTKLYAVWAGKPILGEVQPLEAIFYGQKLEFKEPAIDDNFSDITNIIVQMSHDGISNWETIDRDAIIPVAYSGSFLRYIVSNDVGETISDKQEITINKANYDLSKVYWKVPDNRKYDGNEKTVELINLPESIKASYYGNTAINAGKNTASAIFDYDSSNYNQPPGVEDFVWEVEMTDIDMVGVRWNYSEPFTYDGQSKTIELTKIPEGTTVKYIGNTASVAGSFRATAELLYDKGNYNTPAPIPALEWEIKCGDYDMSNVSWDEETIFKYDGENKFVGLNNVPEDLIVTYSGNNECDAGDHFTVASFTPKNALNMNVPKNMVRKWSIAKADFDMSGVCWEYDGPKVYDGTVQEVKLLNVPEGLSYELFGNVGINVGSYKAKAVFYPLDEANYNVPDSIEVKWEIIKADYDLDAVKWNYEQQFVYNGEIRRITLTNLPSSITAEYENNEAVDCGEYTATVKLINNSSNYKDVAFGDCNWQIVKANCRMQEVCWNYTQSYVYDGNEKTVSLMGVPENVAVSYTGNSGFDAGEYEAKAEFTVSDKRNFIVPEPMAISWQIVKGTLDMSRVAWNYDEALIYDGTQKVITLSNLPEEVEVKYEDNSNTAVGKYNAKATFTVEEKGNYITPLPMSLEWIVRKASFDMSKVSWDVSNNIVYDGNVHTVLLQGIPEGVKPVYTDNSGMNAAIYIASADFEYDEKNYHKPQVADCKWEIKKADYDPGDVMWNYNNSFTYDGSIKGIAVTGLRDDADICYENCEATEAGEYNGVAIITAKDKANYKDPNAMKCNWVIEKAIIDMSSVRWSYEEPIVYNGMKRQIVLTGIPNGVLVKYEGNEQTTVGKYMAKAVFAAKDRNNFVSPEPMECEWEICKADIDMANVRWDYTKPLVFNGQDQEVTLRNLPQGVTATYIGNTAKGTDKYEAIADLEQKDTDNYNKPTIDNLQWEIKKADYDMSRVIWDYTQPLVYNGGKQIVLLKNVPEGLITIYEGNEATNVGKYEATVSFKPQDEANFNAPAPREISWEIAKADVDVSGVKWSFVPGSFIYDGSLKTVLLENVPDGLKVKYSGNMEAKAGEYVAEATFEVEDDQNFNVPVIHSCIWKIQKADYDMSLVRWTYDGGYIYDGKKKNVSLLDIPAGVSAIYSDNVKIDAGQYTAKADFTVDKANYNVPDSLTLDWEIGKATTEVNGAIWEAEREFVYDGKEKSIKLIGLDNSLKVTYKSNTQTDAGEYYAEAVVVKNDTRNYSETKIEGCHWVINKADINMSRVKWDHFESFMYDGSDKKVELINIPSFVEPIYADNIATNAGEYTAIAYFEVNENNYNVPEYMKCVWTIDKAPVDVSEVQWDYSESFTYDGKTKTIKLMESSSSKGLFGWKKAAGKPIEYVGLPVGTTVTYETNSAIEPGTYTAKATIRPADEENYTLDTVVRCTWSIVKQQDNGGQ